MEKVRVRLLISGRVQRVFFRVWTQNQAEKLGLTGWVKNTPEGKVKAVFEGEKEKVEEMVKNCQQGPKRAKIDEIKKNWRKATGEFEGFKIKY